MAGMGCKLQLRAEEARAEKGTCIHLGVFSVSSTHSRSTECIAQGFATVFVRQKYSVPQQDYKPLGKQETLFIYLGIFYING